MWDKHATYILNFINTNEPMAFLIYTQKVCLTHTYFQVVYELMKHMRTDYPSTHCNMHGSFKSIRCC